MDIPNHLSHKPIIKLEKYNAIDGKYAGDSDAEGLSIGLAQWNDEGNHDLSAKVWRYTGEKWSRQSEELPLHRVLDLATLVCAAIQYASKEHLPMDAEFNLTLANNAKLVDVLKNGLNTDKEHLEKSLKRLAKVIKSMGY